MGNDWQNQPGQPPAAPPGDPSTQPAWSPSGYPPQPGWTTPPDASAPPPNYLPPNYPPPGYPPQPNYPPPGYPPQGYAPTGYMGMPSYAGFWIRLFAYFLDVLIMLAITFVLIITVVGFLLLIPLWLGYMPVLWWRRGATYGQSALGLRVVRAIDGGPIDGSTAFVRGLVMLGEVFFFSFFFIGLVGFVWAAFEPRKRAWHDMAAGTVVIHV